MNAPCRRGCAGMRHGARPAAGPVGARVGARGGDAGGGGAAVGGGGAGAGGPGRPARGEPPLHDTSGPERLRALLLQVILVGLVVAAGLLVFGTVADATTDVRDELQSTGP